MLMSTAIIIQIYFLWLHVNVAGDTYNPPFNGSNITYNGRYYVIELISICANETSVEFKLDAFRLHLKLRYFIGRQQRKDLIHPHSRIGFVSYDVCENNYLLSQALTNVLLDRKFRVKKEGVYRDATMCTKHDCSIYSSNVIAVISYMPDIMTKYAAHVLAHSPIPYYAYSNITLSYTGPHPTFYPSDKLLESDLHTFKYEIEKFDFKHIAMVTIQNENKSLSLTHREHLWNLLIDIPGICIDMKDLNANDSKEMIRFIEDIKCDDSLRMIVIWSERKYRQKFLNLTNGMDNRVWFWYSDTPHDRKYDYSYGIDPLSLRNHVFIRHPIHAYQFLNNKFKYREMKKNLISAIYKETLKDKWIRAFIRKENFNNDNSSNLFDLFDQVKSNNDEYVEAVLTPLWKSSPHLYLSRKNFTMKIWKRLNNLTKIRRCRHTITKLSNKTMVCNSKSIHTLLERVSKYNVPECKMIKCPPGFEPKKDIFVTKRFVKTLRWKCVICTENHVKRYHGSDQCIQCTGILIANKNFTNCYDPYKNIYLKFCSKESMVLLLFIVPSILFNLLVIVVFCKYRHTPMIRSSGTIESICQLLAHFIISTGILLLFIGKVTIVSCVSQVLVCGSLLTFVMSITVAKSQNLLFAFRAKVRLSKSDILMSKAVEKYIVAVILLINIAVCAICFVAKPPKVEVIIDAAEVTREIFCQSKPSFHAQFIFLFCLSCFCSMQAYRARNLPQYFSETKEIAFAMYVTMIIIIVRFPLVLSLERYGQEFLNALFFTLLNTTQLFIMYTQTVFTTLFQPAKNTKRYFRDLMMSSAKQSSHEVMQARNRRHIPTYSNRIKL